MNVKDNEHWDINITPKAHPFQFGFREVWGYRDLIILFVKRDLIASYKQTVLGPLWYFIQPALTGLIYFFLYGSLANIPTPVPKMVYYTGGLVIWNYFADCLNITSNVFANNATLFGKVFFPRLIVPISSVFSCLLKFFIQFLLFLVFWFYYRFSGIGTGLHTSVNLLLFPVIVLEVGLLGMSFGLLLSALTTKYRDLRNLISYGLQFGLISTPIIYSLTWMKEKFPLFYDLSLLNPMTSIIETFRSCFWATELSAFMLFYPLIFLVVLFFFSLIVFNKVEKTFLDSV